MPVIDPPSFSRDDIQSARDSETPNESVTLGSYGVSHLGDTLCLSPLPRLMSLHRRWQVLVSDLPNMRSVFENNPYVRAFVPEAGVPLWTRPKGSGHVIQRLLQSFELPVEPLPKPEIHLSDEERAWASGERKEWPQDRPACILSTAAVTDQDNLERVAWRSAARVLAQYFTIVQPVLSEPPVPGAIVYRDLPVRRYMSLVSVADCFMGGTSGGSHVAAAFSIPALIVVWKSLLEHLRFPVSGLGFKACFLYPQHWFIAAEDIAIGRFRSSVLQRAIEDLVAAAPGGRPTSLGNHEKNRAGVSLRARPRMSQENRFRLVPASYGR